MNRRAFIAGAASLPTIVTSAARAQPTAQVSIDDAIRDLRFNPAVNRSTKISALQSFVSKSNRVSCGMMGAWNHIVHCINAEQAGRLTDLPVSLKDKIKPNMTLQSALQAIKSDPIASQRDSLVITRDGPKLLAR